MSNIAKLLGEVAAKIEQQAAELERFRADAERWRWAVANPAKASCLLEDFDIDGSDDADALNQAVSLEVAALAEGK